jgi:hypothetical protein
VTECGTLPYYASMPTVPWETPKIRRTRPDGGAGSTHGSPATLLLFASVDLEKDSVQTWRRGPVPDPLSAHRSAA